MQRNITHQNPIRVFSSIVFFILYSSLSSIYPALPPMLAVLFILFIRALERKEFLYILIISLCLVVFEANNGYMLFSSIIYFYLVYKFILPQIAKNFSCRSCIRMAYVLLAYIGYFLFLSLLSAIFLFPQPFINEYIFYYIVIEFFFVALL